MHNIHLQTQNSPVDQKTHFSVKEKHKIDVCMPPTVCSICGDLPWLPDRRLYFPSWGVQVGKVKQKVHCTWYSMAISHIRLCLRIISFALYIRAVFGTSIAVHLAAMLYTIIRSLSSPACSVLPQSWNFASKLGEPMRICMIGPQTPKKIIDP